MPGKIWVPMPEADFYKKSIRRDDIVQRFGETTVQRAETAAVMNILFVMKIVTATEFVDIVIRQCERIEQERRAAAHLDEDRG